MLKTTITISSDSDKSARIDGALKLGVEPDKVRVEPIDKDAYEVSMIDAPGQVDVAILEDQMIAALKMIIPPQGNGTPASFKDIERALAELKIIYGINKQVIENIVAEVADTGRPRENIQIAAGKPAKDGVDARIEYKFRLNGEDPEIADISRQKGKLDTASMCKDMFAAGDVLAIKVPSQKPVDGCTVTGETISGAEPEDKTVVAGENVTLLKDNVTYVVAEGIEAGYVDLADGRLSVEEPVRVSENKLKAFLSVHPPSESGKMLSTEIVEKLIAQNGIVHGVDHNAIKNSLEKAKTSSTPVHNTIIAKGTAPVRGEDARIELKFETEKRVGTIDKQSEAIDFKERKTLQIVKTGDVLAVKSPLTLGKEGKDVYGDIITSESGSDKVLTPGNDVAVSDDGCVFSSSIDGAVSLTHDSKLQVFKKFDVPGDVDYSTGNLSMDGTLDIKGWIRSGFKVKATGDILVSGGVEDAKVESGGSINILGGIIGSDEGSVHAGENLTVRFLENASVHANGDIYIHDDIVRGKVSANGSVIATGGKGRIRGGSVIAGKVIEMNEIGSPAGIIAHVSAGAVSKHREHIVNISKELNACRKNIAKIDMALAKFNKVNDGKQLPKEIEQNKKNLIKTRRILAIEEERLVKEKETLAQKLTAAGGERPAVKVKEAVYYGTTVVVSGFAHKVNKDMEGKITFILNEEEQTIQLIR
jgi:uncharacterized protein (DUF342 family)